MFHSGGREDTDVRMLNGGRPFVLEMVNPRLTRDRQDLQSIQSQINSESHLIQVQGLRVGDSSVFQSLKAAEDSKLKAYVCVIRSEKPLEAERLSALSSRRDVELEQLTPLRVLHRRSLMTRRKVIHRLKGSSINAHYHVVFVLASAGTYIKEFIHGDLQRTLPNIASLLDSPCDILQLDVLHLYDSASPATEAHFMQELTPTNWR